MRAWATTWAWRRGRQRAGAPGAAAGRRVAGVRPGQGSAAGVGAGGQSASRSATGGSSAFALATGKARPALWRLSQKRPGGGMADTKVLEAFIVRCAGSTPVPGTTFRGELKKANGKGTNSPGFVHGGLPINLRCEPMLALALNFRAVPAGLRAPLTAKGWAAKVQSWAADPGFFTGFYTPPIRS